MWVAPMTNNGHHSSPSTVPPTYPVQLDVVDRPVLVVGGGKVATHKISGLLQSGAAVTVVAPEIHPAIEELGVARILRRPYERGEAASYRLVITCTDDPEVNDRVFRDAEAAGVWANSADDPKNCSFILPAVARRGDLAVTISTGGRSPALATWLRRRFEAEFDESYEQLLDLLAEVRAEAKTRLGTSEIEGWTDALDQGLLELIAQGDHTEARRRLRQRLGLISPTGEVSA